MSQLSSSSQEPNFRTTRWSVVIAAGNDPSHSAKRALADLCECYWYPLYAYLRKRGESAQDAQDTTQGFFAQLLEKEILQKVDRDRGRFRSFLLSALQHFLANERRHARADKRGGGQRMLSLDFNAGEQRYCHEDREEISPQKLFERRWAMALLEQTLGRLQEEYTAKGKAPLFGALKAHLLQSPSEVRYQDLAAELSLTEAALKSAMHSLKKRYRDLLLAAVGETVADPLEVKQEINDLFAAFGS
ncbi:MAG TPA: RNA polymerase subunit sigma-24 [Pirellulales bacterium]|jgi:RNA polymerase sigma-70 factor (ECF subfamily)|nr:RNA polymerase subunit sigma-24 [Pirellulales bacterium]